VRKNVHDQKSCTLLNGSVMVKGAKKSPKCFTAEGHDYTFPTLLLGPPHYHILIGIGM
jgi:hypothetical protein